MQITEDPMPHSNFSGPRWLAFVLMAAWLLSSCSTSQAAPTQASLGNAYPTQILGQWEPGPEPCRLPLTYDSDAGFKITSAILQGYEHTNTPKVVSLISKTPQAWRIESIEEYEGKQEPVTDIFVIEGDYLTVTDGQRSETYRKCH